MEPAKTSCNALANRKANDDNEGQMPHRLQDEPSASSAASAAQAKEHRAKAAEARLENVAARGICDQTMLDGSSESSEIFGYAARRRLRAQLNESRKKSAAENVPTTQPPENIAPGACSSLRDSVAEISRPSLASRDPSIQEPQGEKQQSDPDDDNVEEILGDSPPQASVARADRVAPVPNVADLLGYDGHGTLDTDHKMASLHNAGNTCYLNALLHVLARVPALRHWMHQHLRRWHQAHEGFNCCLCAIAQDLSRLCIDVDPEPFVPEIVKLRGDWSNGHFANTQQHGVTEAICL